MIYAIYLGGFVLVVIWTMIAAGNEPTAHGQSIIVSMGLLFAMAWPLGLIWALVVTLALCARRLRTGTWDWDR